MGVSPQGRLFWLHVADSVCFPLPSCSSVPGLSKVSALLPTVINAAAEKPTQPSALCIHFGGGTKLARFSPPPPPPPLFPLLPLSLSLPTMCDLSCHLWFRMGLILSLRTSLDMSNAEEGLAGEEGQWSNLLRLSIKEYLE